MDHSLNSNIRGLIQSLSQQVTTPEDFLLILERVENLIERVGSDLLLKQHDSDEFVGLLLSVAIKFQQVDQLFPTLLQLSRRNNWLVWLLTNEQVNLSDIYQLIRYYGEITPFQIFESILAEDGDNPQAIKRMIDLVGADNFSPTDYIDLMYMSSYYPETQQLIAGELVSLSEFRPIPSWVKFDPRPDVIETDEEFFQAYGPRNWLDQNNPLDGRMLTYDDGRGEWFRGFCNSCFGRIRRPEHAVRIPLVQGWQGCFCSLACIVNWMNNENTLDLVSLSTVVKLCQEINHWGILAEPIEPEPPRADNECQTIKDFFLEIVNSDHV